MNESFSSAFIGFISKPEPINIYPPIPIDGTWKISLRFIDHHMCLRRTSKGPTSNHGEILVGLAIIVTNLAASNDPGGDARRRGTRSTASLGEGARITLRSWSDVEPGESGWGTHLDFGKARGPWRSARTETILVAHHRRWSADSLERISTRIPPSEFRARFTVGALTVQVGIFTPDAAVGIILGAASGHVAFGPTLRLDAAEGLTGRRTMIPGAGKMAQVLRRKFLHARAYAVNVGSGISMVLNIDVGCQA